MRLDILFVKEYKALTKYMVTSSDDEFVDSLISDNSWEGYSRTILQIPPPKNKIHNHLAIMQLAGEETLPRSKAHREIIKMKEDCKLITNPISEEILINKLN